MSKFRENITKQIKIIDETVSNEDEKIATFKAIQNIIQDFSQKVVMLNSRQDELDEKLTEIYDILTDIEEAVSDEEDDEDDFLGTCPYCGEEISVRFKDEKTNELQCPFCHNIIDVVEGD